MSAPIVAARGVIPKTRVTTVRSSQRALAAEVCLDYLGESEVRLNVRVSLGDAELVKALEPLNALLVRRARKAVRAVQLEKET